MVTSSSSKTLTDDHVLPRPVDRLPSYAHAGARRTAASKLEVAFGLDPSAASCIADAVVDPSELRRSMESPFRMAVPGGVVVAVRSEVWAQKVMPDPRNPRIGPSRRHPFAVVPGTGGEESRFRPIPDPKSQGRSPWLEVEIESREHLTWASDQAKRHVLATNDWRYSIRNQGVLTDVWLTPTRYIHSDGCSDLWVPTTSEGSSRITAVHDIIEARSVDCAYDISDRQLRAIVENLNNALDLGPSKAVMEALRCARVPALILVGYEPFLESNETFSSAVRSLVALRHVDAPKEWGEGPEWESLADAALQEMERRGLLTPTRRSWMAGSITRDEAASAHLSGNPAERAAAIIEVFTSNDPTYRVAIRDAVATQSTRKRLSSTLRTKLATALIVRGIDCNEKVDRIRRYMQDGFGEAVRDGNWKATFRSPDDLLQAAMRDYDANPDRFGSDRLELAARGAYPLIASLQLHADRGTANNNQPDRRTPGQVIDAMLREPSGLRQLHRALIDHANGHPIRVVDENGTIVRTDDGAQERPVTDAHLRATFPPAGSIKASRSDQTAHEKLQNALARLSAAIEGLGNVRREVEKVIGVDGSPLIDTDGVAKPHCDAWADVLQPTAEAVVLWRATWIRKYRNAGSPVDAHDEVEDEIDEDEDSNAIAAEWDDEGEEDVLDREVES